MKYKKAQSQLRYALQRQKTISTNKLSRILQSMNISLHKDNHEKEINYLKGRIRKLEHRLSIYGQHLNKEKERNGRLRERMKKLEREQNLHRV